MLPNIVHTGGDDGNFIENIAKSVGDFYAARYYISLIVTILLVVCFLLIFVMNGWYWQEGYRVTMPLMRNQERDNMKGAKKVMETNPVGYIPNPRGGPPIRHSDACKKWTGTPEDWTQYSKTEAIAFNDNPDVKEAMTEKRLYAALAGK